MLESNLSSYSTSFRSSYNNNMKQNIELKSDDSNNDYHVEMVKSRQTVTPRKSPRSNKSGANSLALTVVDNSTRLRGNWAPPIICSVLKYLFEIDDVKFFFEIWPYCIFPIFFAFSDATYRHTTVIKITVLFFSLPEMIQLIYRLQSILLFRCSFQLVSAEFYFLILAFITTFIYILAEMGLSFSPPTRPTLSPSSFNKEMNRLKKENFSIRDDISRFRNTLQVILTN